MTREDFEILKAGSGVGSRANLERLAKEYVGMNYTDFTKGDSYKDLEKRFVDQGRQAMDDTVGRVAARTGGIASSYATQAGEQAYGGWMEKLEDTARGLYDTERQKKLDEFGIAQKLYAQDYQEKRDQQSDLERNSELTLKWDQYKKLTAEENLYSDILHGGEGNYDAYKKSGGILDESSYDRIVNSAKDVLEDERTKDENDAKENAIERIKNYLSVGTPLDLIDSSLITASGYDKDYWERWRNADLPTDGEDFTQYIYTGAYDDDGNPVFQYGAGGKTFSFGEGVNPYVGSVNPDIKYGTWSNGYQPDNVGGQKLSKTGVTDVVNGVTQNVWQTPDGVKWIWDGTQNKYLIYLASEEDHEPEGEGSDSSIGSSRKRSGYYNSVK